MRTPYSAQELHQALENILPFDVAIDRDRDRHGAASETRELMLEILSHFVRGKHAATDLV
jgi:hypothetical protein